MYNFYGICVLCKSLVLCGVVPRLYTQVSRVEVTTSTKILELTACMIIKMNKKVYMSVRNMPNKLYLTDAMSCMFSKLCLGSI